MLRQKTYRICWLSLYSDLEMQQRHVGGSSTHQGNHLARLHALPLGYFERPVVSVGAQKCITMLDNNQLTIANQSTSTIHHLAVGCRADLGSVGAADADPRGIPATFAEPPEQRTAHRPVPGRRGAARDARHRSRGSPGGGGGARSRP